MLGLLLLIALGVWVIMYQPTISASSTNLPAKLTSKLDRLWQIASEGMRDRRYLRAERALLTILKVDERNATAYNRLGILYSKQRSYNDAIECFEIAQSLEPSASSLHNVGLIYYETASYEKAGLAFEQAIQLEDDVASRHIAYAKVQEKLNNIKKMIKALERAVDLEPNPQSLSILADAYERDGQIELSNSMRKKVTKMRESSLNTQNVQQPRRIVM